MGFLGIKKAVIHEQIFIPHKASKNNPLTDIKKLENKEQAALRVIVENALAGLKRFFILRNKNRMHNKKKLDDAVEICNGLQLMKIKSFKRAA